MYTVKPIQDELAMNNLPTCMYKVKCYYNINQQAEINQDEISELNKQQVKQSKQLERLVKKTNTLCDELNLNELQVKGVVLNVNHQPIQAYNVSREELHLKQEAQLKRLSDISKRLSQVCSELNLNNLVSDLKITGASSNQTKRKPFDASQFKLKHIERIKTKINNNKKIVDDFVIHANPDAIPFVLFDFVNQLTLHFKCFLAFHVHASVLTQLEQNDSLKAKVENIAKLFEFLKINLVEPRNSYDFGFTFIWKKCDDVTLNFAQTNESPIVGDKKIIDHINNLMPQDSRIDVSKVKSEDSLIEVLKNI